MDPYLEKRKREEEAIRKQIEQQLAAGAKEIKKESISEILKPVDMAGFLYQTPGGIFLPLPSQSIVDNSASIKDASDAIGMGFPATVGSAFPGWATSNTSAANIQKSFKTCYKKLMDTVLGFPVVATDPNAECDCPACRAERDTRNPAIQKRILQGYHGRRFEYVYSETLKCHVRIGESLKEKTDADSV